MMIKIKYIEEWYLLSDNEKLLDRIKEILLKKLYLLFYLVLHSVGIALTGIIE